MTALREMPSGLATVAEVVVGFGSRDDSTRTKRILVVEDDADTRLALEVRLLASGYDVAATVDGPRAAYLVRELMPDLVVLDLGLPGLDGFGFLELVESLPAPGRPQVVVHSAWDREEHEERALASGAALYLQKPTPGVDLLAAIQRLLDRQ